MLCLLCAWFGIAAATPFIKAERLRRDNDEIDREVLRLKQQNQRTAIELKALETPEGVVHAARKLGWVQPGEQRLRIPQK